MKDEKKRKRREKMGERGEAIRDARKLGVPKMLILGLQHMFAMFGATILVPILVNRLQPV